MCLSSVYFIKSNQEKELICKNITSVESYNQRLIFTNVLGIPTEIEGEISHIDLVENFIYVRPKA